MLTKMKGFGSLKSPILVKTAGFAFVALAFFYLGKHWSDDTYQQLIFFSSNSDPNVKTPSISISPNYNKSFDIKSLINDTKEVETVVDQTLPAIPPAPLLSPPPPPPPAVQRLGVVDENGVMRDEFEVGEFDPDVVENQNNETKVEEVDQGDVRVLKFETCPVSMREYIPCLDNEDAIKQLKSTEKGERFERHCPEKDKGLNCLVPPPKGYKAPIPWPTSRDEVWYSNVPHAQLAEYKGGQN